MNRSKYWDEYSFLSDRPDNITGNPLIYTAIDYLLTNELKSIEYKFIYTTLMNGEYIQRHPTNDSPTSLDEIIGALILDLLNSKELDNMNWRWYDSKHEAKWYRILQASIYCLGRHRNFFKDNNVRDLNIVAYSVTPWIKYFALKQDGRKHWKYSISFYLWIISVLLKLNYKKEKQLDGSKKLTKQTTVISQKNIAWAILKKLNSKYWIRLINYKKNMNDYFEFEDHPILEEINENR